MNDMFGDENYKEEIVGYTTDIDVAVSWIHKSHMDIKYTYEKVKEIS